MGATHHEFERPVHSRSVRSQLSTDDDDVDDDDDDDNDDDDGPQVDIYDSDAGNDEFEEECEDCLQLKYSVC